jgi:hypothetical protein
MTLVKYDSSHVSCSLLSKAITRLSSAAKADRSYSDWQILPRKAAIYRLTYIYLKTIMHYTSF